MSSLDATTQISGLGTKAAPLNYTVPSSQVIALNGVFASFDGTGAGGDFQPCVTIISDSGHIVAKCPGSTVTAGDSADVTFAPFLEAPAAAASSVTRYTGVYNGNSVTIADNSSDDLTWDNYTGGDAVLNIGNPIQPQVTKTGNWTFYVQVRCDTDLTIGGQYIVEFDVIGLGNGTSVGSSNIVASPPATARVPSPIVTVWGLGWMDSTSVTAHLEVNVTNQDGVSARDFRIVHGFAAFYGGP